MINRIGSRRALTAASVLALATAISGAGMIGSASASSAKSGASIALRGRPHPTATPKPTPTPTPSPTATSTPSPTGSTLAALAPGAVPTSVPSSVPRTALGTAASIFDGVVTVTVAQAGRYVLEYAPTSLGGAFNNVVDGVFLQQTGIGSGQTGYSQTFFLSAGSHTVRLGGPSIFSPTTEYLVGPLS